ncbi:hypothetical protein [Ralstonia pseudosolanacearum]|uniref:hypothetical protein n=1 Tax=Ralstonia pseudosolanacearum TaxID=1310165 RepID=UPI00397D232C
MSLRIFPAKVENLRSQPGCLQRYLSGPLHVNVSSPRGAAGLCNNATPSVVSFLRFRLGISRFRNPLSVLRGTNDNWFSDLANSKEILFWEVK